MLPKAQLGLPWDPIIKALWFQATCCLRARPFIGFVPLFCHASFQCSICKVSAESRFSGKCLNAGYCSAQYEGVNVALAFVRLGDEEICDMATDVVLITDRIAAEDLL